MTLQTPCKPTANRGYEPHANLLQTPCKRLQTPCLTDPHTPKGRKAPKAALSGAPLGASLGGGVGIPAHYGTIPDIGPTPTPEENSNMTARSAAARMIIEPAKIGQRGQLYRVLYEGHILLESTREPLFDACRALAAMGITGRLEMWRPGKGHYDMAVDIERGAGLTVAETAESGPILRAWKPFESQADEHAFPADTSEQGMASRDLPVGRHPRKFRASTARCAA